MKHWIRALLLLALMALMTGIVGATTHTRAERAEIRFLQGMIDHHQMALDMAADCLVKAESPAVKAICEAVIAAQTPEIEQMQAWLLDWYNIAYAPMSMADMAASMAMEAAPAASNPHAGHGGHAGHGSSAQAGPFTDPPMMMGMMAGFNRLTGRDYDIAWLESMIDHHDDAVHMAERILRRAVNDDLKALAEAIIRDQTAEIEQMEALISELGG